MTTTASAPALSPPLIGWLLGTGHPRLVFLASAGALLLCAATMFTLGRARPASTAA